MTTHGAREAHQLFDGLALGAQRGKQRNDRVLFSVPGKNFLHRAFGLLPRKMCSSLRLFSENLHHEGSTPVETMVNMFANGIICKYTWFLSLARVVCSL